RFGLLGDGRTAAIEMASASGLVLVPADRRDPMVATTRGTGELLLAAIAAGARRLIVGIGGGATNDGGAGLGQGPGVRRLGGGRPGARPGRRLLDPPGPDRRLGRSPRAGRRRGRGRLRRDQSALRTEGRLSGLRPAEGRDARDDRGPRREPGTLRRDRRARPG